MRVSGQTPALYRMIRISLLLQTNDSYAYPGWCFMTRNIRVLYMYVITTLAINIYKDFLTSVYIFNFFTVQATNNLLHEHL